MQDSCAVQQKRRIFLLDELRGFAIVMMLFYHFLYDGIFFAGWKIPLFSLGGTIWQNGIGGLFILLSGISCHFSRSNLRRGLRCLVVAFLITGATYWFSPLAADWFGVLHFLGCAMIFYGFFRPVWDKLSPAVGILSGLFFFWLTFFLRTGKIGAPFFSLTLPSFLYANFFTAIFGFPPANFLSSDYYPILPWLFLFLCGCSLGKLVLSRQNASWWDWSFCSPLGWMGRHSLLLYLIHQPILYGFFMLGSFFFK